MGGEIMSGSDAATMPTALAYWQRCMERVMAKKDGDHVSTKVVLRLPKAFDLNAEKVPLLVARHGGVLLEGESRDAKARDKSFLQMSLMCCVDILEQYTIKEIARAKEAMEQRLLGSLEQHVFWLEPNLAPCAVEAVADLEQYVPVRVRGGETLVEGGDWFNLMLRARCIIDPESVAGRELHTLLNRERLAARQWRARMEASEVGAQLIEVEAIAYDIHLPPPPPKQKEK